MTQNLKTDLQRQLTELLLACPSIQNEGSRQALLRQLPAHIADAIENHGVAKTHVLNIVDTCANYSGGIAALLEALRFFDNKTHQYGEVIAFLEAGGADIRQAQKPRAAGTSKKNIYLLAGAVFLTATAIVLMVITLYSGSGIQDGNPLDFNDAGKSGTPVSKIPDVPAGQAKPEIEAAAKVPDSSKPRRTDRKAALKKVSGNNTPGDNETALIKVVLDVSLNELGTPELKKIIEGLQELGRDVSLRIIETKSGSAILMIEGSVEGCTIIEALFRSGKLKELSGIKVLDVQLITGAEKVLEGTPPESHLVEEEEKYMHAAEPEMVLMPGGVFMMGDIQGKGWSAEKTVHEVTLDDFYIGKYEVTFAEYDLFAEAAGKKKPKDQGWGRGDRPVLNVSWHDAAAYAKWLSEQTGHEYRLPTEAEWEYAARAGSETVYAFGNDPSGLGEYAWYRDNAEKKTHPVGEKKPNAWGLHDMHGNVLEWTQDYWYGSYSSEAQINPTGPDTGSSRVIRGGSWDGSPRYVRSANRSGFGPGNRDDHLGFRLARTYP
ncbi:MAG: formylglycine-generating enzyme family protein [Gammaproteobacteria bacterium]|nr:formylglycine-generating enzyme family protein [Gammaproteobacteria bacterium]